jgi:hypothetical protein
LSLCLINQTLHYEDVLGSVCIAPPFLAWTLDGVEWSASHLGRFTPLERAPGTHWIRGWVGRRTGVDALEERKTLFLPGIEPRQSSP